VNEPVSPWWYLVVELATVEPPPAPPPIGVVMGDMLKCYEKRLRREADRYQ
jgi:hypothetical protein